ncbi:MAG TPA: non-heme iron oxygenase ferredoxin subunit [Mycobacteriales bacterium]|nr:non-heme iron oxygenase ferredoxin subunit [Mycobacteriales bacterium]
MTTAHRVAAAADIADNTAIRVEVDGTAVCLARCDGKLYALRDVCSHAEVALSEGDVDDGTVECWLHGSRFDLETGQPTGLPATRPVPVYTVTTEGDDVYVALTAPVESSHGKA